MFSSDLTSILVYNGEIYNDRSLRSRLERRGVVLRSTHSDSEVLIESLRLWGPGILEEIEGMFAFAWADLRNRKLFLSRDRFGQKPLFYARTDRGVLAASESSCIYSMDSFTISESSVQDYFNYGYLVPPLTLAENVFQVCPGETVEIDLDTREISKKKYWVGFRALQEEKRHVDLNQINADLTQSVLRRLVSDRPLGMLLSGGVDSTLVALLCSRINETRSTSFLCTTVAFGDGSFDESREAENVTSLLGLSQRTVAFDSVSGIDQMMSIVGKLDEPLGDASIIPTFLAFQAASTASTVVLTGDGGDELFLGYDPFRLLAAPLIPRIISSNLGRVFAKSLRRMMPTSDSRLSSSSLVEKVSLSNASVPYLIPALMSPLGANDARMLFGVDRSDDERFSGHDELWSPTSRVSNSDLQRWFLTVYLPGSVLTKVDRASMLHSVEARPVFLDNDLLSTALAIPEVRSVSPIRGKKPLRRILGSAGLSNVSQLPKKGFGAPVSEVLRSPIVREIMDLGIPGVDRAVAHSFFDLHLNRERDFRQFLFAYVSLVGSKAFRALMP